MPSISAEPHLEQESESPSLNVVTPVAYKIGTEGHLGIF